MDKASVVTYREQQLAGRYESVGLEAISELAGKRFHLVGVGGVGVSGLAGVLLNNRAIVSGSDQEESAVVGRLRGLGAEIKIGHRAENLAEGVEAVVVSAAIRESNPELMAARQRGIEVYKYANMLGKLMDCYNGIAIAGTHGKSTTSGWAVCCMKEMGYDVNFIVGADIPQAGGSNGVGKSRYFVAEACEYDRSFLNLRPMVGCILNIESDHLDYYRDLDEIVDAFGDFAAGVREGGVLVINGSDANCGRVRQRVADGVRCVTFGLEENCDFRAVNLEIADGVYSFDVIGEGEFLSRAKLSLPGEHNVMNALAVAAIGKSAGLDGKRLVSSLGVFRGVDRRITLRAVVGQVSVIDDYAHHPTEIRASLRAIRQRYEPKMLWCIFQPHQYSRTRFLLDDFAESFKLADVLIVPQIYFVRDSEASKKEINSSILVERIREKGTDAKFIDGFGAICEYLKKNVGEGDVVVTMGAGDVWKVADEYIQWLRENR